MPYKSVKYETDPETGETVKLEATSMKDAARGNYVEVERKLPKHVEAAEKAAGTYQERPTPVPPGMQSAYVQTADYGSAAINDAYMAAIQLNAQSSLSYEERISVSDYLREKWQEDQAEYRYRGASERDIVAEWTEVGSQLRGIIENAPPTEPMIRPFDEITGTEYQSEAEREWYLNQIGKTVGSTGSPVLLGPAGRSFEQITGTEYLLGEREWYLNQIGQTIGPDGSPVPIPRASTPDPNLTPISEHHFLSEAGVIFDARYPDIFKLPDEDFWRNRSGMVHLADRDAWVDIENYNYAARIFMNEEIAQARELGRVMTPAEYEYADELAKQIEIVRVSDPRLAEEQVLIAAKGIVERENELWASAPPSYLLGLFAVDIPYADRVANAVGDVASYAFEIAARQATGGLFADALDAANIPYIDPVFEARRNLINFTGDVGEVLGESVVPQTVGDLALEFIPGVGFVPDLARVGRKVTGGLIRRYADDVAQAAIPSPHASGITPNPSGSIGKSMAGVIDSPNASVGAQAIPAGAATPTPPDRLIAEAVDALTSARIRAGSLLRLIAEGASAGFRGAARAADEVVALAQNAFGSRGDELAGAVSGRLDEPHPITVFDPPSATGKSRVPTPHSPQSSVSRLVQDLQRATSGMTPPTPSQIFAGTRLALQTGLPVAGLVLTATGVDEKLGLPPAAMFALGMISSGGGHVGTPSRTLGGRRSTNSQASLQVAVRHRIQARAASGVILKYRATLPSYTAPDKTRGRNIPRVKPPEDARTYFEGMTVEEVLKFIPQNFDRMRSQTQGGILFRHPFHHGDTFRIMPGGYMSVHPEQRGPYLMIQYGGDPLGGHIPLAGNPVFLSRKVL